MRRVWKTYSTKSKTVEAIRDVSLDVEPGEVFALLGPSGCGKSTLLTIVAGLLDATMGAVFVGGREIAGPHPDVGIMFQKPTLLPWRTVLQNVMLAADVQKKNVDPQLEERARSLLVETGLASFENMYPKALSGGMQARVALCRALVQRPNVLLLDEPFAAVDAITRDRLYAILEELLLETRVTTIFVTHSIEEAVQLSDRIAVMSASPGTITGVIDCDFERPRGSGVRARHEYVAACTTVRNALEESTEAEDLL